MPVLKQRRIRNARPATQIMIDTYMSAIGFTKQNDEGRYTNGTYVVWDVAPRNVYLMQMATCMLSMQDKKN